MILPSRTAISHQDISSRPSTRKHIYPASHRTRRRTVDDAAQSHGHLHDMVEPHIVRFATGPTQVARSMPPDRLRVKILPAHRFELTTFVHRRVRLRSLLLAKGAWGGLGARRAERGEEMSSGISSSISVVMLHVRGVLSDLDSEPYTLSLGTTLSVCARVLARTVEHEEELSSLP